MTEEQEHEYNVCEEKVRDLRHMKDTIENDMPEDVTERDKQSALGRLYDSLEKAEFALMGRMNELDEDYCVRYERNYSISTIFRQEAERAREAGVNFVALWELVSSRERKEEVIAYLTAKGLASLNYELTCKAIEKYYTEKYRLMLTA